VDLAQAAIGPGYGILHSYAKFLMPRASQFGPRCSLALINQVLDEALAEQEGDFDADSRWALAWFEQSGFDSGRVRDSYVLARAKTQL